MKETKNKRIAVITTYMAVEYSAELIDGILEEAEEAGYDIYIFNADASSEESVKHNIGQFNIYTLPNYEEFDGVIVFSNLIEGRDICKVVEERLEGVDIPVVGIDAPIGDHYYVGVENYRAMKAIVEHFIVYHGFREIDFISGSPGNSDNQIRLAAYCDALKEHGIPIEQKRIHPGTFTLQHGRNTAEKIVKSGKKLPQAIVCSNDDIAIGVCSVFKECGVKVPQQVCVSGFDNMFEARNYTPRITSVDRSLSTVGRAALRKIRDHINGEKVFNSELFAAVPVFAGSCGCNCGKDNNIQEVRRKYLMMVDQYEKSLIENNVMIEELNDSKSFDDYLRRLKPHVEALECDRFYLCLDKNLVDSLKIGGRIHYEDIKEKDTLLTHGYSRVMTVAMAYEYGKYVEYDDFMTKQMLPFAYEGDERINHKYIFSPVNFQNICFGYVITENSNFVLKSALYRTWLITLSHELENLRKHTNLRRIYDRLDRLYVVDSMTGAYNRHGFYKHAQESYEDCRHEGRPIMVFFADLDGLKVINDVYSHDKGDLAISVVASALKRACKGSEVFARFGGDEFVAFAADYTEQKAKDFATRFERELAHYNAILEQPFEISASFGYLVTVPGRDEELEHVIECADKKMYINKRTKKA